MSIVPDIMLTFVYLDFSPAIYPLGQEIETSLFPVAAVSRILNVSVKN